MDEQKVILSTKEYLDVTDKQMPRECADLTSVKLT